MNYDYSVDRIFKLAYDMASKDRHEYITIDHLMLIVTMIPEGKEFLEQLEINPSDARKILKEYLKQSIPVINKSEKIFPIETQYLKDLIKNTTVKASYENRLPTIGDFLVSIFDFNKTFSFQYLERSLNFKNIDISSASEIIKDFENEKEFSELEDNNIFTNNEYRQNNRPQQKTAEKQKKTPLQEFAINLTEKAKKSGFDPVIGREPEIIRMAQILSRRKKNNPILVGEAGVGKTSVVEGLVLKIQENDVPEVLLNMKIYSLDLNNIIAGTKYRGEFEKRIKAILEDVKNKPNIILFIDEIHTMVGAGSTSGSNMDMSNILKPYLSSGEIKLIGATTQQEYKTNFLKDKALSRRFSKIDVNEPSVKDSIKILKGLKSKYESFHQVNYSEQALETAVTLGKRFFTNQFLPDLAIDIIDEVGARFKLNEKQDTIVNYRDIQKTISDMLDLPLVSIAKNDISRLKNLEENLKSKIFGQNRAIEEITKSVKRAYAGLSDEKKPLGAFLFTGPTGVGKTELAKQLAEELGINFERFDMSEYMEKHTVSKLIGAPAGYVGYESGGLLTEAIRKSPYTLLLLDEIEKAHQDILNVFLQVLDNGNLTDNNGYKINFEHVLVIMTSNVGADAPRVVGFNKNKNLHKDTEIKNFFKPEFRNRLTAIIKFTHLENNIIGNIINKFLDNLNENLKSKKISVQLTDDALNWFIENGYDQDMGARPLSRILEDVIHTQISDILLFETSSKRDKTFIFDLDEESDEVILINKNNEKLA
jgi:ATP-dependent Clp protease ATP-binding subunit ClpA